MTTLLDDEAAHRKTIKAGVVLDGSTPANDRLRWAAAGLRTATCGCAGSPKHPQQ